MSDNMFTDSVDEPGDNQQHDEIIKLYEIIGEKVGNSNLPRFPEQVAIELDKLIEEKDRYYKWYMDASGTNAEPVKASRIGERKHRDDLPPQSGAFAHLPADQRPEVTMHMFEHEEFIRMMMDRWSD